MSYGSEYCSGFAPDSIICQKDDFAKAGTKILILNLLPTQTLQKILLLFRQTLI